MPIKKIITTVCLLGLASCYSIDFAKYQPKPNILIIYESGPNIFDTTVTIKNKSGFIESMSSDGKHEQIYNNDGNYYRISKLKSNNYPDTILIYPAGIKKGDTINVDIFQGKKDIYSYVGEENCKKTKQSKPEVCQVFNSYLERQNQNIKIYYSKGVGISKVTSGKKELILWRIKTVKKIETVQSKKLFENFYPRHIKK